MKKNLIKLSIFIISAFFTLGIRSSVVKADETTKEVSLTAEYFPDENFRVLLSELADTNQDGVLSQTELDAVQSIDRFNDKSNRQDIASLQGIEYFKNLVYLNLPDEDITSFDATSNTNLQCILLDGNELTSINITGLDKLQKINVNNNHLASIDFTGNNSLTADLTTLGEQTIKPFDCYFNKTEEYVPGGLASDQIHFVFRSRSSISEKQLNQISFSSDFNTLEPTLRQLNDSSSYGLGIKIGGTELADILRKDQPIWYSFKASENMPEMNVEIKFDSNMILFNLVIDSNDVPKTDYILGEELDLTKGKLLASTDKDLGLPNISIPLNDKSVTVSGYDKNKVGKQTLTVSYKTEYGGTLNTTYDIVVSAKSSEETVKPKRLSISPSFGILTKNRTKQLSTKVYPKNATVSELTWASSNTNVASVDENGKITGHRFGITTITATDNATGIKGKTLILVF